MAQDKDQWKAAVNTVMNIWDIYERQGIQWSAERLQATHGLHTMQ
jgi:hypothetical protein